MWNKTSLENRTNTFGFGDDPSSCGQNDFFLFELGDNIKTQHRELYLTLLHEESESTARVSA